ncbi:MAG: chromate transporter [Treponema sp.]|nr:chromate transporter [Treponema sp.]
MIKALLELFWAFIIIGSSIFGGGYAMMPVLQRELINKRNWITMEEVMDYFAIAQITPGIIAVNVATFVGYKRLGFLGGIIATIGLILPGVTLMIIISVFIKQFADYEIVRHAFVGIRIAVCALIFDTLIKLQKGVIQNYKSVIIIICVFILSAVFSFSPVFLILGSALAGFLFFRPPSSSKSAPVLPNNEKNNEESVPDQENEK